MELALGSLVCTNTPRLEESSEPPAAWAGSATTTAAAMTPKTKPTRRICVFIHTPPERDFRFAHEADLVVLREGNVPLQARHKTAARYAMGRLNQNRVKWLFESAPTRPPNPSTSCLTMARPMPAPPRAASRDFSTR